MSSNGAKTIQNHETRDISEHTAPICNRAALWGSSEALGWFPQLAWFGLVGLQKTIIVFCSVPSWLQMGRNGGETPFEAHQNGYTKHTQTDLESRPPTIRYRPTGRFIGIVMLLHISTAGRAIIAAEKSSAATPSDPPISTSDGAYHLTTANSDD